MSSASSAVTYTSVYTDSEPDRAFWGADDEEVSEGGIPRVIVYGYDGLPIQSVAPPSPDCIPGPEDPQTPPVPQDEDEREPMFAQAHDPDYVPESVYPEYIPLEDEHVFPAEEQPLLPVDSPTTESPGYITESDPEEDPKEYEDDETEDGPVNYLMDGGDDGDDDDGDSSGDDADDEDEDKEDEEDKEEEEHLASADSTIVVPTDRHVSLPKEIKPVIPPPSTDITIGARITIRPQASISLPPEAEVERLLATTTPSPLPLISLSPPSAGERLARCTASPAHSSPPPVQSPLLPSSGCPTQVQTLRIASTQALIDAVTAALPSPPLPPPLYIPPPVDRRDDIPESEQPPRKRLCLSTLGSRYEIGESSTARLNGGRGIDYGFVSTVDAEERRHGIRDVGYGIRDTCIDPAEAIPEKPDNPPIVTMADNRTMAQLLEAPTEGYEDAIVIPEITANNFEIKHGLLNLVQNKQFFGNDKEDPHAHIRYFNKITSTMKIPNVPNTSVKLMLFPFSLEGAARIWLEKEPPRSIETWDDLVTKFINKFFPPSKTTNLRNEITRFQQKFDETFCEAWDRFNDLLRGCPHHGFSELHQLDTFYNALNSIDQDSLNSAAGGNFLDKMPRECLKIIESKSKVRQSRNKAVVAKMSTSSSTPAISSDVAELKDMVRALILDRKNQTPASAPVKAVEQSCVTCGGGHFYQNCPATNSNIYHDNIQEYVSQAAAANFNQANSGYRPPMVSNQIRPPGFPPVQNPHANFNRGNNFNQNRGNNFNQGQIYRPPVNQPVAHQGPAPQTHGVSKTDFERYVTANDAVLRNMQNQGQNDYNYPE
ncbi:reverse transcriptase domain-containing protein [Tanacetum coccineum]